MAVYKRGNVLVNNCVLVTKSHRWLLGRHAVVVADTVRRGCRNKTRSGRWCTRAGVELRSSTPERRKRADPATRCPP